MQKSGEALSPQQVIDRFATSSAADKYAACLTGTATDRREKIRIAKGLASVSKGSYILDMPCGTGRLLPYLGSLGYRLAASDSSAPMIERARQTAAAHGLNMGPDDFHVASIFDSPFPDATFDAVVCNRLMHHFHSGADRQHALAELQRISKGPIITSFFCSQTWDAIFARMGNVVRRRPRVDRIPIAYRTFARDIAAAGLRVLDVMPTRGRISKQWYVALGRQTPAI